MVVIEERVAAIKAERALLAPPEPTPQFPKPTDETKACNWCLRNFCTTRNPMPGRANPYLERSRPGSLICLPCRNTGNWVHKGKVEAEITAIVTKTHEARQFWILIVYIWEDRVINPDKAVIKLVEELPHAPQVSVHTDRCMEHKAEMFLGWMWPLNTYKTKMKKDPATAEIEEVYFGGEWVKCVQMEKKCVGAIKRTAATLVRQVHQTVHERSDEAVRGAQQCHDAFAALEKRMRLNVTTTEDAEKGDIATVGHKHKPGKSADPDPLEERWLNIFDKKAKAKAKANKPSGEQQRKVANTHGKRQVELNKAEQVLFQGGQLFRLLADDRTFAEASATAMTKLEKDLDARTKTASSMEHYLADATGDGPAGAMGYVAAFDPSTAPSPRRPPSPPSSPSSPSSSTW